MDKEIWDQRFSGDAYMYGTQPNPQFKTFIDNIPAGKILLPGEGEGRNAVYAASLGHCAIAVDQSMKAKAKAMKLAEAQNTCLTYLLNDIFDPSLEMGTFDTVALVFMHLPDDVRTRYHSYLQNSIKPNAKLFVVGFSVNQLGYSSGGPKNSEWLYTPELLANDFSQMDISCNRLIETYLEEGQGHVGKASLVVFEASKR